MLHTQVAQHRFYCFSNANRIENGREKAKTCLATTKEELEYKQQSRTRINKYIRNILYPTRKEYM